ncbi:MAG TPA: SDR family oxidoreductase [Jatrophihabitantaceae bacterium]|jgi:NAD(P)-dependent dehydrogenase (short-subunit alcohol dehydrogenase family)
MASGRLAHSAVEQIEGEGGHAHFVGADLRDPADLARLALEVGPVDVLVNNAGSSWFGPSSDLDVATYDRLFGGNTDRVRVNAVAPGPVFTAGATEDRITALGNTTLLNRAAQPEEIAETIAFLASPRAGGVDQAEPQKLTISNNCSNIEECSTSRSGKP